MKPTKNGVARMLRIAALAFTLHADWAMAGSATSDPRYPLSNLLSDLARRARIELLFDEKLVSGLTAPRPSRDLPLRVALPQLLRNTGIGFRITPDGTYVLYKLSLERATGPDEEAIPDIVVTGRKTQNADIRRTESDIQHYTVATRREIGDAHSDNLDLFLRSRIPANASLIAPTLDIARAPGSTNSEVDLRGFGSNRTLILIDGRRLPALPDAGTLIQADINGIPIGAIDRVETITSTANGIYGPDAVGGVLNVVLRRAYRGVDFTLTSGITDRGDAGRVRLEGRVGFTPDNGRTDVMLFGSYATGAPLRMGQRDYLTRNRQLRFANDPAGYLLNPPVSNAITVLSYTTPLKLDAEHGGTPLGSTYTYLPIGFSGTEEQRLATLIANAGKLDFKPGPGTSGADSYLLNNSRVISAISSIRHEVTPDLTLFIDGLYLENDGRYVSERVPSLTMTSATAPTNPFDQPVVFVFPVSGTPNSVRRDTYAWRATGGLILNLAHGWKANAELTIGAARTYLDSQGDSFGTLPYYTALASGQPGRPGAPVIDPLGDYNALQAALSAYADHAYIRYDLTNRYSDATLRVAGRVMSLPGGPLTATFMAEQRREHLPKSNIAVSLFGLPYPLATPEQTRRTRSLHAELRAPLIPANSSSLLRGLEAQLAVRYDTVRTLVPDDLGLFNPTNDILIGITRGALTYTAGVRFRPRRGLMLRGNVATGRIPPRLDELQSRTLTYSVADGIVDPKRGRRPIAQDGPYSWISGGSHDIRQTAARTYAIGMVINPDGDGPRFSVDYSRISTRREIVFFRLSRDQLIAAEDLYPDRVVRAPLTDLDRAAGYSAGRVIRLDGRASNTGRIVVDAIDFQLDWSLRAMIGTDIGLYARATWQPNIKAQDSPREPWIQYVGNYDGPLKWRGNAGVTWRLGPNAFDLNMQYYDGYRLRYASPGSAPESDRIQLYQGASKISPQVYLDLAVKRAFALPGGQSRAREIEARLGIQNILNRSASIVVDPNRILISPFGDPRGRRVELALETRF